MLGRALQVVEWQVQQIIERKSKQLGWGQALWIVDLEVDQIIRNKLKKKKRKLTIRISTQFRKSELVLTKNCQPWQLQTQVASAASAPITNSHFQFLKSLLNSAELLKMRKLIVELNE